MANSMEVFKKKLKIELPYDPVTLLLGTYPKEIKTSPCKRGDGHSYGPCNIIHSSPGMKTTWYIYARRFYQTYTE
jgi:hypothetical protein